MMMKSILLVVATCLLSFVVADDQITSLPGIENVPFAQYAGYINVNETTGRNLFYWFTESRNDPATDPVILWLNGGPGCSSLGGLFEELGPFIPNPDGKTLSLNNYSWNMVANVIFLESPSGVGFSYSTNKEDYQVGDVRTANDSYLFLLSFFQQYPQFAKNPFFVTGESYGGHYVPNLAKRILDGNKANPPLQINLQGFAAGNAWTDAPLDNYGAAFYWWTHALISDHTFNTLNDTCDFFDIGPLAGYNPTVCADYQNKASAEMGNIDIYDIYVDVCLSERNPGYHLMKKIAEGDSKYATSAKIITNNKGLQYAPCVDDYVTSYLNIDEVKQAIHADSSITWTGCASQVNYSYTDLLASMLPVYQDILADGSIRILVYSGDVDAIVPITGTRIWLSKLNLKETAGWRPWIGSSGQVGGYTTKYDGLTFSSVRNAGHLVPGTQPQRALDLISSFFADTL
eukprot:TRINITY_DN1881_c0_g1_i1.p1 TRINITY_DN1881_c0_g1~~TRINITY_DN1881_c0_g1_i1.p1  ORF type:complete len:459 (-),score=135.72 TRINITY_DN1881_c0_g1_i1:75-1451(-)